TRGDLQLRGIFLIGDTNFPNRDNSRSISSSLINGGTFDRVIFLEGLLRGKTGVNSPPITIPVWITSCVFSIELKNKTIALFILEPETTCSWPTTCPTARLHSSMLTLDSTFTPWRRVKYSKSIVP